MLTYTKMPHYDVNAIRMERRLNHILFPFEKQSKFDDEGKKESLKCKTTIRRSKLAVNPNIKPCESADFLIELLSLSFHYSPAPKQTDNLTVQAMSIRLFLKVFFIWGI